MVGTIQKILLDMVEGEAGAAAVAEVKRRAGVPVDRVFRLDTVYSDDEWQRLLAAACEVLEVTRAQAMEVYARYFCEDAIERWPTWFRMSGSSRQFLERQPTIHNCFATGVRDPEARKAVVDTGVGIPAEKLPLLFQRFRQVDATATRKYEGTGLGLALVREFAELIGGRAGVESEPGQGSRFWVRVPRSMERLPAPGSPDALIAVCQESEPIASRRRLQRSCRVREPSASPGLADLTGKSRLLIVEDNPDMRAYLTELLAPEYEVTAVANGRKALEAMSTRLPDIVLSDVMMPEMDGMELVTRLKGDPELRELPVILLTARAGSSAAATGLEIGADDYVSKPFTPRGTAGARARGMATAPDVPRIGHLPLPGAPAARGRPGPVGTGRDQSAE